MKFKIASHRFAEEIIQRNPQLSELFKEITDVISGITDDDLMNTFENRGVAEVLAKRALDGETLEEPVWMSLSYAINQLMDYRLHVNKAWDRQSPIFQGEEYSSVWTMDFSKSVDVLVTDDGSDSTVTRTLGVAVEVAFNHQEAIAWNLMKPVLAAEINHLEKKLVVDSGIGVIVVATEALKKAGAFDSSVGSFEKVAKYLIPMRNQLTVPLIVIGLEAPENFTVSKQKDPVTKKNTGVVIRR